MISAISAFNKHDISRDACMLRGPLRKKGYDWWWHSFTAQDAQTGEDKAFFVEFFLCNPALAEDKEGPGSGPILGQLSENKAAGQKPSYVMVKAGCWGEDHCQLHRFFAWDQVDLHADAPYQVQAADCLASETRLTGSITISEEEAAAHPEWMCDSGSLSWDLQVDKQVAFNVGYGASKPLRDIEAFAIYWHAEGMKTAYQGRITHNGRVYTVSPEKSYGYADKNWGRDFTSPWVWLSSNCLVSKRSGERLENSVFDIGGGRPQIYPLPLNRRLLGAFWYEGKEYDFNFSKLHEQVKTDFSFDEYGPQGPADDDLVHWHVRQESMRAVMETDVYCRKSEMLFVNYEAPDGSKKHQRLWNGGTGFGFVRLYEKEGSLLTLVDEIEASHVGCEYGEYGE
ncbi:MAG: hypothetical protein ACFNZJ_05510 [Parascardovia denticolens]